MKSLKERIADREQREEEAKRQAEERTTNDNSAEELDYSDWTVPKLKEELEARGVDYDSSAKKADLVAALEANDAE